MSNTNIRDDVISFAHKMSDVLNDNDSKGGWDNDTLPQLINKMSKCVEKLKLGYLQSDADEIKHQAVNIANYCLMLDDII